MKLNNNGNLPLFFGFACYFLFWLLLSSCLWTSKPQKKNKKIFVETNSAECNKDLTDSKIGFRGIRLGSSDNLWMRFYENQVKWFRSLVWSLWKKNSLKTTNKKSIEQKVGKKFVHYPSTVEHLMFHSVFIWAGKIDCRF